MSRITIHLKRAGDQLRNDNNITTLSSPKTIFFNNQHRRPSSTQFWDHPYPFDTSIMPEEEDPEPRRLSADQTPLPPSPSPSIIHDVPAERISTAGSSSNHHHRRHDIIHKPPPLVIARPKIHDIQIV
jgi:hypothetical protein